MTLCDTGPLVALLVKNDSGHARCAAALAQLPSGGLLTTWPCFTEAMHIVGRAGGWPFQQRLWEWVEVGLVSFHLPDDDESARMSELMAQYSDTPMDLADASLVSAAERRRMTTIFTLDAHFRIYRVAPVGHFDILP